MSDGLLFQHSFWFVCEGNLDAGFCCEGSCLSDLYVEDSLSGKLLHTTYFGGQSKSEHTAYGDKTHSELQRADPCSSFNPLRSFRPSAAPSPCPHTLATIIKEHLLHIRPNLPPPPHLPKGLVFYYHYTYR